MKTKSLTAEQRLNQNRIKINRKKTSTAAKKFSRDLTAEKMRERMLPPKKSGHKPRKENEAKHTPEASKARPHRFG